MWGPEVIRYTSKNGLPTSMIFEVIEDRHGYIWLATNHGAVRYDGHTFRTYTTRDGLINNTILNIVEDNKGRLWFLTLSKQLCYFDNGHIYRCAANPRLERELPFIPSEVFFEEDGTIRILLIDDMSLYTVRNDMVEKVEPGEGSSSGRANFECRKIGDQWMTRVTTQENGTADRIISSGPNYYNIEFRSNKQGSAYICQPLKNGSLIAVNPLQMLLFDKKGEGQVVYSAPDRSLNSVTEDSGGDTWLLTRKGAYRYRGGISGGSAPQCYLPGTFITSVLRDRAGNYWFSSWDNGLYCFPGMQFQSVRVSASPVENAFTAIKVYDDRVWFVNTRGSIFNADESGSPSLFLNGQKVLAPAPESIDFIRDAAGHIWIGQTLRMLTPLSRNRYRAYSFPLGSAKALLPLRDGRIAVGMANGLAIIANDSIVFNSSPANYFERTNALCETRDGSLWLGAISGLYRYDGKSVRYYGDAHPLLRHRIVAIAQRSGSDLILGTQGVGVLIMRENGKRIYRIDADSGLAGDIVRTLYVENDSVFWVGTNKGVSRVAVTNDRDFAYDIVSYTTAKGLPSNGINGIIKHHGLIWLATDDGICRFNPDSAQKNRLPLPIDITEVAINGTPIGLRKSYRLSYDRNNISVSFVGIGFRTSEDIRYRYRLFGLGKDTMWHETVNRAIPFFALPPGDYLFQVSTMNEDGVWNPAPKELHFEITPHYTQTLWFQLGVIVLSLLAVGLIVWRILEHRRRTYAIDAQIRELRQQALSAHMNPHFISNSLSVVQAYVLRHEAYEANEFLARFSRLIRLNLETSLKSFVPLQEELERLELYLSLEKLRFGHDLEYVIRIDDAIDPDETLVPSMLMQPYVENAIRHGLLPTGRPGLVEIAADVVNPTSYTITIRDNGMGLSATEKKRESEHESLSMKLNHERLVLLSKSMKRPFSIHASETSDTSGNVSGTAVTITLPRDLPLP